jgi:hypothetical protein
MKRLFIIVLSSVVIASQGGISQAEVSFIKGEGSARKMKDEAATKISALNSALKNAVASVIESFMSEEARIKYSDATEKLVKQKESVYVLKYRVLKEGWITHHDEARKDDREYSLHEGPRSDKSPPAGSALENLLAPDKTVTGVEYFHVWIEAKVDVGKLRKDVLRITAGGEQHKTNVTILILDVLDYATYESIKNRLARLDIIRDISYGSFSVGRIVLNAEVHGTAHTLWERLDRVVGEKFVLIPSGADKLIIKAPGEADRGL